MEISSNPTQNPLVLLEQTLSYAQNLIKLNVVQQIDVSQLAYMGNLVDMYV